MARSGAQDILSNSTAITHQLEGPQEVRCVAEVGADGHDLVDEVLDADDAVAPELLLDQVVGGDGSPLAVDLRGEDFFHLCPFDNQF